jgi:hypothetical protein
MTISRRNASYRRSILKDWRPNGQRVYRDEPNQMNGAPDDFSGYRPVQYAYESGGIVNNGAMVQWAAVSYRD